MKECSVFDYIPLTETLERNNDMPIGYGRWEEKFTILPNIKKVKEIIGNIMPLHSGKYWLVYDNIIFKNKSISNEMVNQLEKNGYWHIDYITIDIFNN